MEYKYIISASFSASNNTHNTIYNNLLGATSIQNIWLLAIYQLKEDEKLFDGVWKFGPLIMKK